MNKKLLIINAVGLTENLISDKTPHLQKLYQQNKRYLIPPIPALTTTSQADLLTGVSADKHGIVANGWYFHELEQVWLWRQANKLVQAEKVWEKIRKKFPDFTVAKIFWWYNMYSSADYSVTVRPIYRADGAKYPGSYSEPANLNNELEEKLGTFPLFDFWGPMTSIKSTQWIADSAIYVMEKFQPNLNFVYLPHLDYNLQRLGPDDPKILNDVIELDAVCAKLIKTAEKNGYHIMILSEYGIMPVDKPVHINKILRKHHFISVRTECGEEHFDAGGSTAFAVADHQIAHIYIRDPNNIEKVKKILLETDGIAEILIGDERKKYHLDHERSGDIICLAQKNAWFTYYYWLDDSKAPDFARTVDIHKKPGYDPVELFLCSGGKFKAAKSLLKKKLGMRYTMDVIPLDANLVKGSHGVLTEHEADGPLLISDVSLNGDNPLQMRKFSQLIEDFFDNEKD